MRYLVAVPVCHRDNWEECPLWVGDHPDLTARPTPAERIAAVRDTWWKSLSFDRRFFYGYQGRHAPASRADEVELEVPDYFRFHCAKNQAMFRWALEHDYDYVYRCDDDTFVHPARLEQHARELTGDQIGYLPHPQWSGNYITGGAGYWISRKGMELVVSSPITRTHEDDLWIGRLLKDSGVIRVHDPRYRPGLDGDDGHSVIPERLLGNKTFIAVHSCSPETMKQLWRQT